MTRLISAFPSDVDISFRFQISVVSSGDVTALFRNHRYATTRTNSLPIGSLSPHRQAGHEFSMKHCLPDAALRTMELLMIYIAKTSLLTRKQRQIHEVPILS